MTLLRNLFFDMLNHGAWQAVWTEFKPSGQTWREDRSPTQDVSKIVLTPTSKVIDEVFSPVEDEIMFPRTNEIS